MKPEGYYHHLLQTQQLMPDEHQAAAVVALQRLYDELATVKRTTLHRYWRSLLALWGASSFVRGIYLWGNVGVGKTRLMDIFYHCLSTPYKQRLHFHQFMQKVHHDLKQLQGYVDPLKAWARQLSVQTHVICLDEFLVTDIADAMLLANVLEALFNEGIMLVATSNVAPDDLYRRGLQRGRFLPAIDLLKRSLQVMQLRTEIDYRLRTLQQTGLYFMPLDEESICAMRHVFYELAGDIEEPDTDLWIEDRQIPVVHCVNDVVWFDFDVICEVPRSQIDYLAIAERFSTVLISNIPQLQASDDNAVCYFMYLVDIFYDAKVKLVLSAAVSIAELYPEGRYVKEFQRTQSRLLEMQSVAYLHQPHTGQPPSHQDTR